MDVRIDVYHHFAGTGPAELMARLDEIKGLLMTNQEKIDAMGAAVEAVAVSLKTSTDGIRADIQALKDQAAAGQTLDFTAVDRSTDKLRQAADALAELDAANPPASPPVLPT